MNRADRALSGSIEVRRAVRAAVPAAFSSGVASSCTLFVSMSRSAMIWSATFLLSDDLRGERALI